MVELQTVVGAYPQSAHLDLNDTSPCKLQLTILIQKDTQIEWLKVCTIGVCCCCGWWQYIWIFINHIK